MAKEITCEITQKISVLGENEKGYTKAFNLVSWNGATPKVDIREWHPGHERCGKGITLSESEGRKLMEALIRLYHECDPIES